MVVVIGGEGVWNNDVNVTGVVMVVVALDSINKRGVTHCEPTCVAVKNIFIILTTTYLIHKLAIILLDSCQECA